MAAPLPHRDRNDKPYGEDNGRGGFGKFPKRPFQRTTQATPYDRPPTSIRNLNNFASNSSAGNSNGWLSKLVDPAQRLITASAHKLFASLLRKRLPPPPPQLPETETKEGARDEQNKAVSTDRISTQGAVVNGCDNPNCIGTQGAVLNGCDNPNHIGTQGAVVNGNDNPSSSSNRGEVTELELILKEKTFTRSEIDRLTALLQSRTVDLPAVHEERKSEAIPSKAVFCQDTKEDFLNTPVKASGMETRVSAPIFSPTVVDEDVASPAELAKAYMGTRPSKVSPSMLGLPIQPLRENSVVPTNPAISSKSPIMSVVPRSSGHTGFSENGFVTPRSRGRSAIYSMPRTPYTRAHSTTILQGTGSVTESFRVSSSTLQSTWENNRFSGSKQGALKRRSSVLDNDIGSVGPIRRIRQKSNLLRASGTPIHGIGLVPDAVKHQSSSEKPLLVGEKMMENGDNSFRGPGFTPVPSKSSEMASKILQQLDVLVTSRDKSPAKLSPSMLRGPALKSLENVDSSKFLGNTVDNNRLDVKHQTSLPDERDSVSQKQEKSADNGPIKSITFCEKSVSAVDGVDTLNVLKNNVPGDKTTAMSVMSSILQPPVQMKRAFQMTAHEDYLDVDDDYSNGTANATLAEGSEKLDTTLTESKSSVAEAITVEKSSALTLVNPPSGSTLKQKTGGVDDKSSSFAFPALPSSAVTVVQTAVEGNPTAVSDKGALQKQSNDAHPVYGFEDKFVSPKESNDSSGIKFGASSDPKPENSSPISVAAGATESLAPESGKADDKNSLKADVFRSPEALPSAASTSSTASLFQFGITANTSILNNGSAAPSHSFFSPTPPVASDGVINQSSSSSTANVTGSISNASVITITTSSDSNSSSTPLSSAAPSFVAAPLSKFAPSVVPSTSTSPISTIEFKEAKTKETSFGNPASTSFGGTSSAVSASLFGGMPSANASTGNNIFGGASAMTSSGSNIFGGTSAAMSSGSNIFGGTTAVTSSDSNIFGGTPVVTSSSSNIFGGTPEVMSSGNKIFGGTPAVMSSGSNIFGVTSSMTSSGSKFFSGQMTSSGSTSSAVTTSTGSGLFSVNAGATTSAASNQSEGFNALSGGSASASTGGATSSQSMPILLGSSASSPSLGLTGNTNFSSSSFLSTSTSFSEPFSSSSTFRLTPTPSSGTTAISSNTSVFGSSWQGPKSPILGSSFNSTSSVPLFSFGASQTSTAATGSTPMLFGSSAGNSSGSFTPFSSPAVVTQSQSGFGNSSPSVVFGSTQSGNGDHMSTEENMAEDTVPTNMPTVPVFDQQPISTTFVFGSTAPSGGNQFGSSSLTGANPFLFGSQSSLAAPQNPSSFQTSGSLEFNAGGSFSLGTGGGDKATRKFVKVRKTQRKK